MIRSEREYDEMQQRLDADRSFMNTQREELKKMGLTEEQVEKAMSPAISFYEQLKEEVEYYEKIKRGEFEAIRNLDGLGRILIGVRIALGITQKDLSDRLGVSEAQISKDERNEYHGITLEKAQRVLDALGITLMSTVEDFELKTA